jgi:hypothetical protein
LRARSFAGARGKREIWSAGSKHHSAALKIGSRRQAVIRGQARQAETTSANDRGHSLSNQPAPRRGLPRARVPACRHISAAAPGAAGLLATAGQLPKFSRRSGVTPGTRDCYERGADTERLVSCDHAASRCSFSASSNVASITMSSQQSIRFSSQHFAQTVTVSALLHPMIFSA